MNKTITLSLLIIALLCPQVVANKFQSNPVGVSNIELDPQGNLVNLNIQLDVSALKPSSDHEYCITPVFKSLNGLDSIVLQPVFISGRNLYYVHQRDKDLGDALIYKASKKLIEINYSQTFNRTPWFDNAQIKFNIWERNCCDAHFYDQNYARLKRVIYKPVFNYVNPVGDSVKIREINRRAYINFPVNRTELFPDYMNNPKELSEIIGTIDSVRNDKDITIQSIFIKGFASPEGPYSNNVRLAKGRTATLKGYVENLYKFAPDFIKTAYEPEDWEGLEEFVKSSNITNKDGIMAIIKSNLEPDAKDQKLRTTFPEQYRYLLASVYPMLRHSDYRIEYQIRSFTSIAEILDVLHTAPQKLSLNELYRAAQSMTPGSNEYNEVFEVAVRMFPDNEAANINAANNAMSRGEYDKAEAYLNRVGDDPTAIYARGVLASLRGNYNEAEKWFGQAARLKVADAPVALQLVREVKESSGNFRIIKE